MCLFLEHFVFTLVSCLSELEHTCLDWYEYLSSTKVEVPLIIPRAGMLRKYESSQGKGAKVF
jgi:hypothetical protein